eukprot:TRINITY_DN15007_c0_g2_i2.p1 TRINITY_DN15007_c0_g2~~TRINITY_DN15007_c0_g2_i2.p1  ORF type:complete len:331 (+),score=71.73 TRINITY_DN15007_c0_g2_i2:294-1286(+)
MIKPESHGCQGWSDTISHGIDYIATRPMIARNFGDPEGKVERKERVPDWSVLLFHDACLALGASMPDKERKKCEGIGISHMLQTIEKLDGVDDQGDVLFEMQRQVAQFLMVQNQHWWTQNPSETYFFEEYQLKMLHEMVEAEQWFRYRVGNEVFVPVEVSLAIERAFKVVQRTPLGGNWDSASDAIPEVAATQEGYACAGVLLEALVRLFLPQERRLKLCFEDYLGKALDESIMNLCGSYLHAKFVEGEMGHRELESLLQISVKAILRIQALDKCECSVLSEQLQGQCDGQGSDADKLQCIRQTVFKALSYLLRNHFEKFLTSRMAAALL